MTYRAADGSIKSYQALALAIPEYDDGQVIETHIAELVLDIGSQQHLAMYHVKVKLEELEIDGEQDYFRVKDFKLLGVMTESESVFTGRETLNRLRPVIEQDLNAYFDGETRIFNVIKPTGMGPLHFDGNKNLYLQCRAAQDEKRLLRIVSALPGNNDNMTQYERMVSRGTL